MNRCSFDAAGSHSVLDRDSARRTPGVNQLEAGMKFSARLLLGTAVVAAGLVGPAGRQPLT